MASNWNIPVDLEKEIRERDKVCVYCGSEFLSPKESAKASASWEHIINDASIVTRENIFLCCRGCNASKGQKQLSVWLQAQYCVERGITPETVAPIIKQASTTQNKAMLASPNSRYAAGLELATARPKAER